MRAIIVMTLAVLFASVWPAAAQTARGETTRYAAIVVEPGSGTVLHARHGDAHRAPASLVKMMTLYMVFDALESGSLGLGDLIRVSEAAAAQPPSRLGLEAGDTIRVLDVIKALVVRSGNDAAVAIAERLAGDEPTFAAAMNTRAFALGLTDTHFANASGLPHPDQRTTARDMARLAHALQRDHPTYYPFFMLERVEWKGVVHGNHNHILRLVEGADGLKTGFTNASGYNVAAAAERDGRRFIVVVLGADSPQVRDAHAVRLFEAAFGAQPPADQPGANLQAASKPALIPERQTPSPTRPEPVAQVPVEPASPALPRRVRIIVEDTPARPIPGPGSQPVTPSNPVAHGTWAVQVGAFALESQALAHLKTVAEVYELETPATRAVPAPDLGVWRAWLLADTRSAAQDLCARLQAAGERCFALAAQ